MKSKLAIVTLMLCLLAAFGAVAYAQTGNYEQKEKSFRRGWLGVSIQDVNEKIAKKHKLKNEEGAYVSDVVEDSPADSAGIREGDVIVEFNGRAIEDSNDLLKAVSKTASGTKTSVVVVRDGEKKTFELRVGKQKSSTKALRFEFGPEIPRLQMFVGSGSLGLQLMNINEQLGEYFGVPGGEGVLVQKVEKESPAEKSGFKAGDVIVRAGKRTVEDIDDVFRELGKHDEGDKVEFEVIRKGAKKTLTVEIEEKETFPRMNFLPRAVPRIQMFKVPHGIDSDVQLELENLAPDLGRMRMDVEKMTKDMRLRGKELRENIRHRVQVGAFINI